jgi:hypothetical protein
VSIKNAFFWDIKSSSYFTGDTSPLQSPSGESYVRFDVFPVAIMKNSFFWDIKFQFVPH